MSGWQLYLHGAWLSFIRFLATRFVASLVVAASQVFLRRFAMPSPAVPRSCPRNVEIPRYESFDPKHLSCLKTTPLDLKRGALDFPGGPFMQYSSCCSRLQQNQGHLALSSA